MKSKNDFFEEIKNILIEKFDIPEDDIFIDSEFVKDFDLDSIDAAEIIVEFKKYLPPKVDASMFREMKTIRDLITLLMKN